MSNKQQAGGAMRRFPRKIARTDGQLDDLERQLIDATKVNLLLTELVRRFSL